MDGEKKALAQSSIADVASVRRLLIDASQARRVMTYGESLAKLGHEFSFPKMIALCRTLDAIDSLAEQAGEPALAVLVVRQSDGLPGQGWWVGRAARLGYDGPWEGAAARAFVGGLQAFAFDHWGGEGRQAGEGP